MLLGPPSVITSAHTPTTSPYLYIAVYPLQLINFINFIHAPSAAILQTHACALVASNVTSNPITTQLALHPTLTLPSKPSNPLVTLTLPHSFKLPGPTALASLILSRLLLHHLDLPYAPNYPVKPATLSLLSFTTPSVSSSDPDPLSPHPFLHPLLIPPPSPFGNCSSSLNPSFSIQCHVAVVIVLNRSAATFTKLSPPASTSSALAPSALSMMLPTLVA